MIGAEIPCCDHEVLYPGMMCRCPKHDYSPEHLFGYRPGDRHDQRTSAWLRPDAERIARAFYETYEAKVLPVPADWGDLPEHQRRAMIDTAIELLDRGVIQRPAPPRTPRAY